MPKNRTELAAIRHAGIDSDAMISMVGVAAALTVREGNKAGPTLVRWKAFCRARIKAPMRQNRRPVPEPPLGAECIQAGAAP